MPNFNKNQTNIISLIAKIVDPSVFQYHSRGFCHGLVVANFILSNCFHVDFFEILAEIDNYKQQNPTGEPPEEIVKKIDMVKTAFSIICGTQLPFCSSTIGNLQQIGREISQFKCKENVHAVGKMLGNQSMLSFDFLPIESPPLTTYDELNSTLTFLLEKITTEQILQLYTSEGMYHSTSIRSTKTTPPIFYLYDPNNKEGEKSFSSIDDLIKEIFYTLSYNKYRLGEGYKKFKNGTTRISCLLNLFSTTEINDSEILAKKRNPTANITPASFQYKGVNGENLLHTLVFGGLTEEEWKEILNNPEAKSLINTQDEEDNTPLHYACLFNNSIAVKALLDAGANVINEKGLTAFSYAVYGCAYDVLKTLCEQNKIQSTLDYLGENQPNVDVALFKKCIFDAGNNLRSRENIDWVAANVALANKWFLFDLIDSGKVSILKQLALAYPENISQLLHWAKDMNGYNMLLLAAKFGQLEAVTWLAENYETLLTEKNYFGNTALFVAASCGELEVVRYLSTKATQEDKNSFLLAAAANGWRDVIKALLQNGADPMVKDVNGYNMLSLAAEFGQLEVVTWLAENYETLLTEKNYFGNTSLFVAASCGKLEVVRYLSTKAIQEDKNSVLLAAAANGWLDVIKALLQNGADPMVKDVSGYNMLSLAAKFGQLDVVEWIAEKYKILLTKRNKFGNTALFVAASCGKLEVVRYLSTKAIQEDKNSALLAAAANGHLDVMKELQNNGADPLAKDEDGDNMLSLAAEFGQLEAVKWIAENYGTLLTEKNYSDDTALSVAAIYGKLEVVVYLSTKATQEDKNSALLAAAANGWLDVIKALLQNGADPLAKDEDSDNMLLFAAQLGQLDVVEWIAEKYKILLTKKNKFGNTALFVAASCGKLEVVRYLSTNATQEDKNSALLAAAANRRLDVIKALLQNGADPLAKNEDDDNMLSLAVKSGQLEVVIWLTENYKKLLTEKNKFGDTALSVAASNKKWDMVIYLSTKATQEDKNRVFLTAAANGPLDVIKALQPNGADLLAKNDLETRLQTTNYSNSQLLKNLGVFNGPQGTAPAPLSTTLQGGVCQGQAH